MRGKNSLSVDDKMATVNIKIHKHAHIIVNKELCGDCPTRPCLVVCTAENYQWDEKQGALVFNYEGCLECGACRIICPRDAIEWSYPEGGFGVKYRFG